MKTYEKERPSSFRTAALLKAKDLIKQSGHMGPGGAEVAACRQTASQLTYMHRLRVAAVCSSV